MDPQWLSVLSDPGAWFWWVGAGVLLVVELMSGTFYLLMIALGFLAAGVLRLGGGSGAAQVIAAAVLSALAVVAVRIAKRRYRRYRTLRARRRRPGAEGDAANIVDVAVGAGLEGGGIEGGIDGAVRASGGSAAMHDPAANLDIGATVHVAHWLDRRARATYRGAQWDAVLIDGADDRPGWYRINRIEGIRLVLEPAKRQHDR